LSYGRNSSAKPSISLRSTNLMRGLPDEEPAAISAEFSFSQLLCEICTTPRSFNKLIMPVYVFGSLKSEIRCSITVLHRSYWFRLRQMVLSSPSQLHRYWSSNAPFPHFLLFHLNMEYPQQVLIHNQWLKQSSLL